MSDLSLVILPTSPHDPHLLALIMAQMREIQSIYGDPEPGTFDSHEFSGPRAVCLLACLEEQPVGCGLLRPIDAHTAEVKRMYVHPDVRGRGIARRMLSALEQQAAALSYERLILETGEPLAAAVLLYKAAGYGLIASYGPYAHDPTTRCFEKWLTSA